MATDTTEDRGGTVAEMQEKGGEILSTAQEQVVAKAGEVRQDAAFQIREQIAQRSSQAGDQVHAVAHALRSGGEQLRTEQKGSSAELVDDLAQRVEKLGSYLSSSDPDRMLRDVEEFARRRPWLTAGCAALAGFVASRLVKASSDRRYETSRTISGSSPSGQTGLPYGAR
jgi:ElaB/YqjD/DUF883 family membrane-anchored ribosome-binding protein